jgi:drug/metabolite transporter (DMT)-like permease
MESWHVAAALLSAALHAGWNAAVKVDRQPHGIMTAQMVIAAVMVLPAMVWSGLPSPAAWPWIAASTTLNMLAVTALLRVYALFGFGIGYPVVRALSVMLVVPIAALLSGERLSVYGLGGVGLIALALVLLGLGNDGRASRAGTPRAGWWIVVAGVATAVYVMCDAKGVRAAGSPFAYGFVICVTNAAAMLALQASRGIRPWHVMQHHGLKAIPVAAASVASYLLILVVWSRAPIAPAAALRDTSAVFALLIAVFWLHESLTRLRLAAVICAAVAIPLLRWA